MRQTRDIEAAGGRRLRVEVAGDSGRVVIVQLGSPEATPIYGRWVEDAAARGLTLVAYDRPGYGGSTAQRGRSVADCAADVRAISEAVGFDRCAVWGFSGGGPHALACGALLDDLVAAVATTASWAPFDAPGLDYFAGMPEGARDQHELFVSDREKWERSGEKLREDLLAMDFGRFSEDWAAGASEVDAETAKGEFGMWLHRTIQAALAPGLDGWTDDIVAFHAPWGFDPAAMAVPVKLWYGGEDRMVPITHGQWLADTIPNAQPAIGGKDGHLTVAAYRIGEVHEWLATHL